MSVKDLFIDAIDPVLVYLPLVTGKDDYLVIMKEFREQKDEESEEMGQLEFIGLSVIRKDADLKGLYKKLSALDGS